jgi:hypothetical protein
VKAGKRKPKPQPALTPGVDILARTINPKFFCKACRRKLDQATALVLALRPLSKESGASESKDDNF